MAHAHLDADGLFAAAQARGTARQRNGGTVIVVNERSRRVQHRSLRQVVDVADRVLVGVARSITDFSWCCYLSELAVSPSAQGLGVGKGLMDETRRLIGPRVSLVLASMPDSVGFYERIGMPRQPDAFWFKRSE